MFDRTAYLTRAVRPWSVLRVNDWKYPIFPLSCLAVVYQRRVKLKVGAILTKRRTKDTTRDCTTYQGSIPGRGKYCARFDW